MDSPARDEILIWLLSPLTEQFFILLIIFCIRVQHLEEK